MKHKGLVVFGLLVLMGLFASLSTVKSAAAGSNGQQLEIGVGCTWGSVTVTGRNQRGQTVKWSAINSSMIPCTRMTVKTSGWWWVGPVTIVRTNPTRVCNVNVPQTQRGDWVKVSCQ